MNDSHFRKIVTELLEGKRSVQLELPKNKIMEEAHDTKYSVHPGGTKMYWDLREVYWWIGMKREIVKFVAQCLTCQKVKAEHSRPVGPLQPLPILEWKWEHVTMDCVPSLPRTPNRMIVFG